MSEIKSTLDIIMEKTKDLSMSEEEKEEFHRQEAERDVRGLLRKFLEGVIDIERFQEEMAGSGQGRGEMRRRILIDECLSALQPDGDNGPYLQVLKEIGGLDIEPLEKVITDSARELEEKRKAGQEEIRKELEQMGISGTAVIPNVKADKGWKQVEKGIRDSFHEKVKEVPAE